MGKMLIFDLMFKDEVCSHVEVNLETKEIACWEYSDVPHHVVFGKRPHTIENLNLFLERRCFPKERPDCQWVFAATMSLPENTPYRTAQTAGPRWTSCVLYHRTG